MNPAGNGDPVTHIVDHPTGSYHYTVGADILASFRPLAGIEGPTAIVTDERTAGHHLSSCGDTGLVVLLPAGRNHKTLASVQEVHRRLLDAGLDRSTTIVSLGDSIVSDVASFAAATYLRGVDVVHLPTELIAMIDTSVGGKVGLDVPHGRNLVGLFKQPAAVVADVSTLRSLTGGEFAAGMAEVVKHALVQGGDLLDRVEGGSWHGKGPSADLDDLQDLVARAVEVKIEVVREDPYDEDRRQVLNLGHTFAYAFESATLGELSHGEAVGIGLIAATRLSKRLGLCSDELPDRVEHLVGHVGLRTRLPRPIDMEPIDRAMAHDKKRHADGQRFVLLEAVGKPLVLTVADRDAVHQTIASVQPSSG